ncbi:nitrogenase cofactor biosynthesis protein NifB [Vibrio mangrovi]|uniref:FeMo cofactor biosynthesis protein NifB n=1 Tax=Vibrio mangrovi TaxID=474394 RepID=A0A1Y6INK4_9VIBR|nr:nitrogenase cofactor biosynthesis protein NifB [Vibrio mangrovi]MDW6003961.1 nitrogenase cofactor biosynthesis protein NifB [Vibrio mangrovi]SMR99245.1 FeMo cofactor biosynthesis protein NifB [Vibrio mangrovi]
MESSQALSIRDSESGHPVQDKVRHFLAKEVQEQIARHPCYSQQAHQYARIHLPVAPACNIQCNYCNRKYDCSNESRPGVVSQVMESGAALRQYMLIKKRAPNLTVAGIAGPGDALANPQATFATLKQIRQFDPDVQLCVSTNGLALAEHVETLVQLGVHHLTVTINCVTEEIGEKIYPWIFFNHQRLKGREAARTLIERQLLGLELAAAAGMLVKVNTVLIPGVNDHHIADVSVQVKHRGALLHNIMPLISEPEHGTYFGLTGQRGPTEQELATARSLSGIYMPQMTHCRQCRADAVGMLGDSPCSSAAKDSGSNLIRVAVASDDSETIRVHFGHATKFEIYQYSETQRQFLYQESRYIEQYCHGKSDCPDAEEQESQLQAVFATIADCLTVFSARMGISPWRQAEELGIQPNVDFAYQPITEALAHLTRQFSHDQQENEDELCHQR